MNSKNTNNQNNDDEEYLIKEEVKKTVIELFINVLKMQGLSKSVGEVWGCIFIAENPLCIDDIMEELGISRGSVSMSLNTLEKLKYIEKIWIKGERKQYYVHSCGFSIMKDLTIKKYTFFSNACNKLRELDKKSSKENKLIKEKLQNLEYMEQVLKEMVCVVEKINEDINYTMRLKTSCEHDDK